MLENIKKFLNYFNLFIELPEKSLVVIIPSYNNALWYKKNLNSVFSQIYSNYRVIYIDDNSNDDTALLVENYIKELNKSDKVTLIKNNKRKGATANRYLGSHLCNDNEVILILDGDDWFAHDKVFKIINKVYSNNDIWLTYGQFRKWPTEIKGQCKKLPQNYNFRLMDKWYTSALRTYYAWLFKKIKKEDLMKEGEFYQVAGDVAEMLPMLEMARGHIRFISKVLYIYNVKTSNNDFKTNLKQQFENTNFIKNLKPYSKIQI